MNTKVETIETVLPKGRTLRIQDGKGLDLTVVTGCLWVTYEHDTEDSVFETSGRFRVVKNGLTLVHAFSDVRLRIAYPVEAGAPSLTLGGGYRDVGAGILRAMLAQSFHAIHGRIVAGMRAPRPAA